MRVSFGQIEQGIGPPIITNARADRCALPYFAKPHAKQRIMTEHPTSSSRRTVLITGGTSGIGQAIALAFAAEGCRVIATGVSQQEVGDCAKELGHEQNIEAVVLDVTDVVAIEQLTKSLTRLDVLVNAAGVIIRGREHGVRPQP